MWRLLSWLLIAAAAVIIVAVLIFDTPKDNAIAWGLLAMVLGFSGTAAGYRAKGYKSAGRQS